MASDEPEMDNMDEIFYVPQKALDEVRELMKKGEEPSEEKVKALVDHEDLDDEELMVPVDLANLVDDLEDVEQMLEKMGVKGTADIFIKAAENLQKSQAKVTE